MREQQFREFHFANPEVYTELVDLARQARAAGQNKIGIRMLWEVCRWYRMLNTTDTQSNFKLNDHYHSRYARLIMEQEPDLAGIFELRELKT